MSETFPAASAVIRFDVASDGTISNVVSAAAGFDGGAEVSFDADSRAFRVDVTQRGADFDRTFAPGDVDEAASDGTFRVFVLNPGSDEEESFTLQTQEELSFGLSHVTFGVWSSPTASASDVAIGHVVFGIQTPDADMPTTGTATYSGVVFGTLAGHGEAFLLSGSTRVTADFGDGSIAAAFFGMTKENLATGAFSLWRDFTSTGSIISGSNLFSGTAQTMDGQLTGSLSGGFFGPADPTPPEVGGTWNLEGAGETAVGSFVAGQGGN